MEIFCRGYRLTVHPSLQKKTRMEDNKQAKYIYIYFCMTETTVSEVQRKELGKEKGILGNELTRKRKGKKLCKN